MSPSALSREEMNRLFEIIQPEKTGACNCLHFTPPSGDIQGSDRVTVMRDGRKVATETLMKLLGRNCQMMVGRSVRDTEYLTADAAKRLAVKDFRVRLFMMYRSTHTKGDTGDLRSFGSRERTCKGTCPRIKRCRKIFISGVGLIRVICEAIDLGIAYLTEDRKSGRPCFKAFSCKLLQD